MMPATRKPIVGANWKCNPGTTAQLPALVSNINACDTSKCDVYVCPSSLHVGIVYKSFTSGAKVAPQNCNFKGCGAYTGEMAVDQMKSMGIEWVLIGHSERRGEFGLPTPAETNKLLATKLSYIQSQGLKCVLAIGEPLPVREKGLNAVMATCAAQLGPMVPYLDPTKVVIAYEPVWAIGTGVSASAAQAQETHKAIRDWLRSNVGAECADGMRIQYGGSANAKNAAELSAQPDIDGFLVGSASLKPEIKEIVGAIADAKGYTPPMERMSTAELDADLACLDAENKAWEEKLQLHKRGSYVAATPTLKIPGLPHMEAAPAKVDAPPADAAPRAPTGSGGESWFTLANAILLGVLVFGVAAQLTQVQYYFAPPPPPPPPPPKLFGLF